ncbi:MAG: hypothetical protein COT84_08010 [Chlamydiae bacterium CG10_big_fil_rev_8_21_14_0_10_35_9]|nr:MAG: hypothetical protein COT84_08010 [Chlamydiae bacterium CG10_big_fil_rev_8_21_14_0_10_35_9]
MNNKVNEPKKKITHHRALAYLLQNRVISSYGKLIGKEYENLDSIDGKSAWCDFAAQDEWGEVVLAYQENLPVQFLWKNLFYISLSEMEEMYNVKLMKKHYHHLHLKIVCHLQLN